MINTSIIDIAIGLAFVYLLLGLICSSLTELVSRILSLRSKDLKSAIENLLEDEEFTAKYGKKLSSELYDHPLIKRLAKKNRLPSYIPSNLFARSLLDSLSQDNQAEDIIETIEKMKDGELKKLLKSLTSDIEQNVANAKENLKKAQENIEIWYDEYMDRVSGWYTRKAQSIAFIIAVIITVGLNVDSLVLYNSLKTNPVLAQAMADKATELLDESDSVDDLFNDDSEGGTTDDKESNPKSTPGPTPGPNQTENTSLSEINESVTRIEFLQRELNQLNLPIGWDLDGEKDDPRKFPMSWYGRFERLLGWLFTALAVTLGAPFWFDALKKFMNVRSAGKKPKSTENAE